MPTLRARTKLPSPAWLDAQYDNRARVPEHAQILERWARASALVRESADCELDLAYGRGAGETLDVFPPTSRSGAPVLVFIHGGYWRALDKRDQSFVAPAFLQAGAMVVVPNYALCPAVSIEHIVLHMVAALAWVHRNAARWGGDARRIVVAGHSAGGQLAAMLLNCDWSRVAPDLPRQLVRRALAISGVFDLEPLRRAPFIAGDLRLTRAAAARLSPARLPAPAEGTLVAVVGAHESKEFQRQNAGIRRAWGRRVVPVCEAVAGANHFTVLHELVDARSGLHRRALELLDASAA